MGRGVLAEACRAWFALGLVVTVLYVGLVSRVLSLVHMSGVLPTRTFNDLTVLASVLAFRTLLLCNPQIRITVEGDWAALSAEGAALLLMNHSSFFDFFLFTSSMPVRYVLSSHLRTVISAGLSKLPVLGATMGVHAGSFFVYFQAKGAGFGKGEFGDFSVDRDKQQAETDRMDKHIEAGGAVAFCPEGGMNKTPPQLRPFRRGSFGQAVKYRTPVWGAALVGCPECWPMKAAVGGFPARVGISISKLLTPAAGQDAAAVADACQAAMQAQVDAFAERLQPKTKAQ